MQCVIREEIKKNEGNFSGVLLEKYGPIILQLLKNNREEPVGEIARNIKLSFKATSKHLVILFSADILDKDQRSLQIYYSLSKTMHPMAKQAIHLL